MGSFNKAVKRIKREIKQHGGERPEELSVPLYPTAEIFARYWPGEDFAAHRVNRTALIEWLKKEDIHVVEPKARDEWPLDATARAEKSIRPFYRLGMSIGGKSHPGSSTQALGWMVLILKSEGRGGVE